MSRMCFVKTLPIKLVISILSVVLFLVSQGCAHKKVAPRLTQEQLQSKRVALTEVKGAKESQSHVEVAIVNEILDQGRFEIIDRATVQDALVAYPAESDWQRLGKKVGADYVLSIKIIEFTVKERQGYDKVAEEDSVLTEESGESKPVVGTRYTKVKSFDGLVRLQFALFDVNKGEIAHQGIGTASEAINSREKAFSGKMALLERLSRRAVIDFFERLPK